MSSMPVIAIVGRPNVGKSSLLNALAGRRISIVEDTPGVTRDRISTPLEIDGHYVELVDTGGFGFVDAQQLTAHIRQQIEAAIARADLVLLVGDCHAGLTSADEQIASLLRRKGVNTVLIANKADGTKADAMLGDFARLGLGTPVGVSAKNGRNIEQVLDAIRAHVDLSSAPTAIPEPQMLVAIVGKRNSGKSTLVNSIAQLYEGESNRVIVSEVPGTTRDSVDVRFEKDGKALVVIDTAGVRKKRHMVTHDLEFYSFHRAQRSIRRADVVLMLIDAAEPFSEPDKKLAQYIEEQHKPVVIVVNKWDIARQRLREQPGKGAQRVDDRQLMEQFRQYIEAQAPYVAYAPLAFITAKEGKNVQGLLDLCQHLFNQARQRIPTGRLNAAIRAVFEERLPPAASGRRPKIFYATQIETAPPTIVLIVNHPEDLDASYQRFVINRLRELLPFPQVPIRLILRPRTGREEAK